MHKQDEPCQIELPDVCHPDDPAPEEIREACLRIQATWTEEERRNRASISDLRRPFVSAQVRSQTNDVLLVVPNRHPKTWRP